MTNYHYIEGKPEDFEAPHGADERRAIRIRALPGDAAYIEFRGIVMHRVTFHGHMHLTNYGAGLVGTRDYPDRPHTDYSSITAYRSDRFLVHAESSQKNRLKEAVWQCANIWGKSNPDEFIRANLEEMAGQLRAADQQERELAKELEKARQTLSKMTIDFAEKLCSYSPSLWPEKIDPSEDT